MKVIPFTIPVAEKKTLIVQEDRLPYFYPFLHRHEESQLTLIVKGEGTLLADNNMHPFKEGDLFFIGANQPHIFKSGKIYFDKKEKQKVHSLTLFFNPEGSLRALTELPEMGPVKKWLQSSTKGYRISGPAKEKIKEAFLKTCSLSGPDQLISFIELLKQLTGSRQKETLGRTESPAKFTEAEGSRLNEIYQYSIKHFTENITLKKVAAIAHLTIPAFCRYFKKRTGKTYTRFLNELRISEASRVLVNGHFKSISEVAWDTGFVNISSFNRTFKQINGISPRRFIANRKQL